MQKRKSYRGIDYVRVSELPQDEQIQIRNIEREDLIIKIQVEETTLSDCILYSDYEQWYKAIYTKIASVPDSITKESTTKPSVLNRIKHRLLPNT